MNTKILRYSLIVFLIIIFIFGLFLYINSNSIKYYVIDEDFEKTVFIKKTLKDYDELTSEAIGRKIIESITNDECFLDNLKPTSEIPEIDTFLINGSTAMVYYDKEFSFKSPLYLQLYKSCIIKSLCETKWVDDVIFINDEFYNREYNFFQYTPEDIVMNIDDIKTKSVDIYHVASSGDKLIKETKHYYENYAEDIFNFVVRQVSMGPSSGDYLKILPSGFRSYSINVEKGLCTITFSDDFLQWEETVDVKPELFLYAITNSLCSCPGVEEVKLAFSYNPIEIYRGVDISKPLYFDASFLATSE